MRRLKLPSVAENTQVILASRKFLMVQEGETVGEGTVIQAINQDCVEVALRYEGEDADLQCIMRTDALSFNPFTKTGFVLGGQVHSYEELDEAKNPAAARAMK